jgi:predicted transcriptional regulator
MHANFQWIYSDESLLFAAARLKAQGQQKLPVVDRDQKLVGMIYDHDIILSLLQRSSSSTGAAVKSPR